MLDEATPLRVKELTPLLKKKGKISLDGVKDVTTPQGNLVHLSVHPNRLYLKERSKGGVQKHHIEEMTPQAFNARDFRLICVLTPPPFELLPEFQQRKGEEKIVFDYEDDICPQISVYEINESFNPDSIKKAIPDDYEYRIVRHVVLGLRKTQGEPGVWRPNMAFFGKVLSRRSIRKKDLERIIGINNVSYDISSIPENDVIENFVVREDEEGRPMLVVEHSAPE